MTMDAITHIYRKRRNYARHAVLFASYMLGLIVFVPAQRDTNALR